MVVSFGASRTTDVLARVLAEKMAELGHYRLWVLDRFGVPPHILVSPAGRTATTLALDSLDPARFVATESETGTLIEARLPMSGAVLALKT